MIGVDSPFIEDIPKCKISMRKLRKKIYKYTSAQPKSKKVRDSTHDICKLLEMREIPDFVLESLKKKRSLDLNSLKNVVISPGSKLPEMTSMVRSQENEVERIFRDHRARMKTVKRAIPKLEARVTTCSSTNSSVKV